MKAVLRRSFVWTAIITLFLDQLTKMLVYGMFAGRESEAPVRVLGDILRLSFTTNPRGVFGLTFGPPWVHFLLQCVGVVVVLFLAVKNRSTWLDWAYGLVLGGAFGNLVDRLRLGYVIDFIDFELRSLRLRWFTFNLADAFVVIGAIMIFIYEFRGGIFKKHPSVTPDGKGSPLLPLENSPLNNKGTKGEAK